MASGPRKSGRPHGRPKASERVIGPAEHVEIGRLWLRHWSLQRIAVHFGVSDKTIKHHLELHILPAYRANHFKAVHVELARVNEIERVAWEQLEKALEGEVHLTVEKALAEGQGKKRSKMHIVKEVMKTVKRTSTEWVQVIEWCVDWRSRIHGYYAPDKMELGGEIRVAGKSREDIDATLKNRISQVLETIENRKHLESLGVGRN